MARQEAKDSAVMDESKHPVESASSLNIADSTNTTNTFVKTGDAAADADIAAFYRARDSLVQQRKP